MQNYNDFQTIWFDKIYAKKVQFYFNFGVKNNPMISCLACGYIDVISKIMFCYLNSKKNSLMYNAKIYPLCKKDVIKMQIRAKISMSIFDLFWCFVEAKINEIIKKNNKKMEIENGK